jgi:hypothetical protein
MGYKLKKTELICIAEYVIKNQCKREEILVSEFYEMLMYALDSQKENELNYVDNNENNDNEQFIELDSSEDDNNTCITPKKNQKIKKSKKNKK